ncbi:polysaccharide biosynthesis/export family protein [Rhodospirillum sp. A1_3_36]|uniref:polysaccharide biosynthesis/export family protein n=1 Tax=Rhodospirillum sp. A1_3_36 TaxID=3391666 RepID=UPI0039A69FB5
MASCTGGPSLPDREAPSKIENPAINHLLEPGNRVGITVFGETNLSGDFFVDPSGTLALPLVGSVAASGITTDELSVRIRDLLVRQGYLRNPQVSVEIRSFRPFYVLGEVRQPGEFEYNTGMTVLGAIARAGGYDYRAIEGDVVLVRTENDTQIDYRANEKTPILPGDIVRVLERRF